MTKIGKRLAAVLLAVAMAITFMPILGAQEVYADDDISFQPWDSNTSLPTASGSYSLTQDVTLNDTWVVPGTVDLCLNGYSITLTTSGSVIKIESGATLDLYDSNTETRYYVIGDDRLGHVANQDYYNHHTGEKGTFTGGYITHSSHDPTTDKSNPGVEIAGGTFIMHGGTIIGNNYNSNSGGGVANSGGTFTMDDGNIIGNSADTGGGVYVEEGRSFTMSGGSITGNTAVDGGGVLVEGYGTFSLTGGEISGNTSSYGGGVFLSVDGRFYQSGGSITGNTAAMEGGGVNAYNESTFTMPGGSITGNTAKYGGGVSIGESTTFTMSQNASVTSNTAQERGGGVYVPYGTFNLSGAPSVTGNKKGSGTDGKDSNVWLKNNKKVSIAGSLTDGASVGVTMQTPGTFTSGWNSQMGEADPADFFTSDDDGFAVFRTSAGEGELKAPANIEAIEIDNLCLPQEGAAPDTESFTTNAEAAGYKIEFVNWIDCDANQVVNPEDTFKRGTKYAFDIKLSPLTSGYVFPEDKYNVSVTVNGKRYTCDDNSYEPGTALWWYGNEREWLRLKVYYKVPETITVPAGETLTYNGSPQTGVAEGANYQVTGNVATDAGSYEATASLKYKEFDTWADGTTEDKTISWTINKATVKVTVPAGKTFTYNGKAQTGVAAGTNYTLSGTAKATKAGTYTAKAALKTSANYTYQWSDGTTAAKTIKWTINIAANPLTIKAKTATVKYSKLKKKTQTLAVTKVIKFTKKLNDKKTYTLVSAKKGSKSFKKYFKINKTTGKVTIKKNKKMKKGTYKVKVKVKALGNSNYNASAVKTVTFKVKVK